MQRILADKVRDRKLQTAVSWTAEDGSFVHRVVTQRLQVTSSRVSALRGVDCETSALLLAKRVMQEARVRDAASNSREAEKLQRAIGESALHALYVLLSNRGVADLVD